MAERHSNKPSKYERSYRILEYLKRNTDQDHKVKQSDLRKIEYLKQYIGNKETFNDTIVNMANAMNSDSNEMMNPEEEWRIIFDAFAGRYGSGGNAEEDDEEDTQRMPIRGLYYNQIFSYDEINSLIEGILFSKTIAPEDGEKLIEKIESHLTTKFYPKGAKQICRVNEPQLADQGRIRENLKMIQKAIEERVQIRFRFYGYNRRKELEPVRKEKDTVSPYYLVANGGKYYLLACKEVTINGEIVRNMSIWRVDLMGEMEIPGRDEKLGIPGIPALKKESVENLPKQWSEDFHLSHLNMAFDEPVKIRLKITRVREKADYTFLHDWFGDTFRFVGKSDIVEVMCSPFAMVNWALQYSDRVEVLEPESIRRQVAEKARRLYEKYGEN